ncbi:MAG TPA: glycosyltransferase family 2 protein [Thermodesulfovibrionales bacterium]|nr:glycosyltransferase family 2 protein [Thermodesulfovibrionales bacterium]
MNSPRVSVCIPTYNYAGFLPEAIDSVQKQTFTDYEILIIDDCSRDNTKELLVRYAKNDKRIRFKINSANIGMVNNWNSCLTEAKGEYIKFVFGDDLLSSPEALQKMVTHLDLDPDVTLVGSARYVIDGESRIIKVLSHFKDDTLLPGRALINRCLSVRKNLIGEPTAVMFRKRDAERGFNPRYKQLADLEMWFHLLEKGKFAYLKEPLCSFRRHVGQETAKNSVSLLAAYDNFYLYDEYMNKPYVTIPLFHRNYIRYDNIYRIWKLYTTNDLAKEAAVREIDARYGYGRFLAYYPFYKIYKPFLKFYRNLLGQGFFVARHGECPKR